MMKQYRKKILFLLHPRYKAIRMNPAGNKEIKAHTGFPTWLSGGVSNGQ